MVPSGDTAQMPEWSGSWKTRTSTRSPGPSVRRVSAPSEVGAARTAEASSAWVGVRHALSAPSNRTRKERERITEAGSVRHGHPNIPFVAGVVDASAGGRRRPCPQQVASPTDEPFLELVLRAHVQLEEG